jgi:hypothetical protein
MPLHHTTGFPNQGWDGDPEGGFVFSFGQKDFASAEVLGVIILITVIACGVAIIATTVFSQSMPQHVPSVNIRFSSDGDLLTIYHMGGDPVPEGQYFIRINNNDISPARVMKSPVPDGNWVTGEILTVTETGLTRSSFIQVVYQNGDAKYVIATNSTP